MTIVARFEVLPLHAQVEVRDAESNESPEWETGEELAVASAQCIAVATQSDVDGRVLVEVRRDEDYRERGATLAFDGELLLTGSELVVGNSVANDLHSIDIGRGWHRAQVWTKPRDGRAAAVIVILSEPQQ